MEGLSALLGNIFYNLQHIHIGEHLWYKTEFIHKWEGAETPPTDLQSGFSQVFGQRSGELALSMATTEKVHAEELLLTDPRRPLGNCSFNLSIMGVILPFPVTRTTLEREGAA